MSYSQNTERGSVTIIILLVVNLALAGVLGWQTWQKVHTTLKPTATVSTQAQTSSGMHSSSSTTGSQNVDSSVGSLQLASRNVSRKNDASLLMGAVMEYINNNSGQLPTAIDNGQIHGSGSYDVSSQLPPFAFYKSAMLQTGTQPALAKDMLVVVTAATCSQNGATVSGTSRQVAIQYSVEQSNGSFTGACTDQ